MTAAPYYADDSVTLWHGDCIDVLATLPAASVDAVVCDPPYGLGFMGKAWDSPGGTGDFPMRRFDAINTVNTGASRQGGRQRSTVDFAKRQARDAQAYGAWCELWAAECLRVLKPGGFLLAFGGTRTYHRIACAVEDAGFEVRDSIAWLYGSGFPKSVNVGEGRGTALKPAHEPIVVGRKSTVGTVAANVAEHGTGALNIDACRIAHGADVDLDRQQNQHADTSGMRALGDSGYSTGHTQAIYAPGGRWPTNVLLDQSQADALDAETGVLPGGGWPARRSADGTDRTAYGTFSGQEGLAGRKAEDGGASRFFPTFRYEAKAPQAERPRDGDTIHPTVKPLDLMRWLVRLVAPRGGLVLDPFLGSGTTAEACVLEGLRCIGIEREADYLPLTVARLSKPLQVGFDFGEAS